MDSKNVFYKNILDKTYFICYVRPVKITKNIGTIMTDTNNDNEVAKGRIGYGVKVPRISFEEVIQITKIAGSKAGESNSIDVLSRITGNSSSSSTFSKKVAALRNFGLFEVDKSEYSLTEIGKQIATPESFEQQARAIIQAFLNQEHLRKIWEAYKGKRLPQVEYLANAIIKVLNVPAELKLSWAEYFIEAGKYAGLLEEREAGSYQVLSGYTPALKFDYPDNDKAEINTADEKQEIKPYKDEEIRQQPKDPLGIMDQTWGVLNVKTISNNRKAIFAIPEDLSQQDIDALKVFLKGIEVQLDGLKKIEDNN